MDNSAIQTLEAAAQMVLVSELSYAKYYYLIIRSIEIRDKQTFEQKHI